MKLPNVDCTGSDVLLWKDQNDHFWAGPCSPQGRSYFTEHGVPPETVAVEVVVDLLHFLSIVGEELTIAVAMADGKTGRVTKNSLQ